MEAFKNLLIAFQPIIITGIWAGVVVHLSKHFLATFKSPIVRLLGAHLFRWPKQLPVGRPWRMP